MTDSEIYIISRIRDEVFAQNKKLANIAEQLEVQTRLQEEILKQLYLLCQIAATPIDYLKTSRAKDSAKAFEKYLDANR